MKTIELLLKKLNIKFTRTYLQELYELHPYKNTLWGISDILSEYKVKSTGFRVKEKEDLLEISLPAIASIGNQFIVISEITSNNVSFLKDGKEELIAFDDFFIRSNGIILTCETDNKSIEPNYKKHKKTELFSLLRDGILSASIILLIVLGAFFNGTNSNIGFPILLLLNLSGIYVGWLLLQEQMNTQNSLANRICSLIKKGNCNAVLHSSASKFMGVIGWSEVGLGYYIASLLILLFIPSLIPCLGIISCLALSYTFWSIWFQKFIIKQWCVLCLIVQLLLWLLFITYLLSDYVYIPELFIPKLFVTGCIFFILILSINRLIPYLIDKKNIRIVLAKYNSLKINNDVFKAKLRSQRLYDVDKNTSSILFGNKEAKNLITIVSNPHCEPCAIIHEHIKNLLGRVGDKICIQYIFSSFSPDLESSSKFLIAVFLSEDISLETRYQIYDEWFEYGKLDPESFFKKYTISCQEYLIEKENMKHRDWRIMAQISSTPTILFNGYKLPDEYNIDDIAYFTDLNIEEIK